MTKRLFLISLACVALSAPLDAVASDAGWNEADYTKVIAQAGNLHRPVLEKAITAYHAARQKGMDDQHIMTLVDYSLPSSSQRLWVLDMARKKILFHTLVAHGEGSGGIRPDHFSNTPETHASSIGLFETENTYVGHLGYSLALKGLEPGFNDKALSRHIVMHSAWYVTPDFVKAHGRAGRSWGCLAIDHALLRPLIKIIKGGTLVFSYFPDKKWLTHSRFLNT